MNNYGDENEIQKDMYLPGAASLIEQIDCKILVVLRDGRYLIGILRSFDQYLNLIVDDTFERVTFQESYCDLPLGLFVVRGDNIVLLGEIDEAKELTIPLNKVSPEQLAMGLKAKSTEKAQENKLEWDFE